MKQLTSALGAAVLVLAACGGAAAPTASPSPSPSPSRTPSPTPSPVSQVVFTADLKASNAVPPVTDAEKDAAGTATITLDLTRDASGKVTSATAKFEFTVNGLPATSKVVGALVHEGAAGANGAGKINSGITADTALAPANGTVTFSKTGIAVSDAAFVQALMDNPSNYYVLVHTALHASGATRGQLSKKS